MNRPHVFEELGKSPAYILDEYLLKTWKPLKDKMIFHKHMYLRNLDNSTSIPCEIENASLKAGVDKAIYEHNHHIHSDARKVQLLYVRERVSDTQGHVISHGLVQIKDLQYNSVTRRGICKSLVLSTPNLLQCQCE
jgi:hypothetical protein